MIKTEILINIRGRTCPLIIFFINNSIKRFHNIIKIKRGVLEMSVLTPYINAIDTITDDTISDVIESRIVNCDKNILIYKEYGNINLYNNDIYQESGNGVLTKIKNGLRYIWEKIVLIFRSIVNKISSLFNKNKINEGDSINDIADNVISKNKNHTKTLV